LEVDSKVGVVSLLVLGDVLDGVDVEGSRVAVDGKDDGLASVVDKDLERTKQERKASQLKSTFHLLLLLVETREGDSPSS